MKFSMTGYNSIKESFFEIDSNMMLDEPNVSGFVCSVGLILLSNRIDWF